MDEALYRLHADLEETYWWFVAKNRIILHMIERFGPAGGRGLRALDIGCGAGGLLARLGERFESVGVDMSPLAREYCTRRGLTALDGCLPDGLPFQEPASFDVIVMSEVLEHVPDDRGSVSRVVRLLRPGGLLVCTVPAHQWLWSAHDGFNHHQRRYSKAAFADLFRGQPVRALALTYANAMTFPLVAAVRLLERALSAQPASAEIKPLPIPLNGLFRIAFESEKWVSPIIPLPFGTSVLTVHRRIEI